jgi:tetratricopeptide (TPR) repeat protein
MKNLILASGLLVLTSCASTGPVSQTERKSEAFVKDVTATSMDSIEKNGCKASPAKYGKWKWKDLMKEADACVVATKWQNVTNLGMEMSQRDVNSPWGPYFLSLSAESDLQFDRALWMLELATKRAPNVGLFHYQKGRVLWKRDSFKEATNSLAKAIQLDPNLIDAHLFLGQIYFRDQEYSRAARHFQAVLSVRPRDPTALMGLAECQIQTGDAQGALELLRKGERLFSDDPVFSLREAHVYEYLLNDVPKAIEIYKSIAASYRTGAFSRPLDFNIEEKIKDLEMSAQSGRSIAGSHSNVEVK